MATRRFRGIPPPPSFSLAALADDVQLTEIETASALRESIIGVSKKRLAGTDGLDWRYVDGRPRCIVGSLKKKLAGSDKRLPSVHDHIAAKAADVAKPVTETTVAPVTPRRGPGRPRKVKAADQSEGAHP
jgi:hypothetical protein